MGTESEKKYNTNEEIDLIYFFRPIINLFKGLGKAIASWFKAIYKYFAYVFIITAFAGIAGFSLRFILPHHYKTDGIFISHVLNAGFCQNIVENLNQFLSPAENIPIIAEKLNISNSEAQKIVAISTKNMFDTLGFYKDTATAVIKITLVTDDTASILKVQKGIVNLLENNEYAYKRKKARLDNMEQLRKILDAKIQGMDTLKKIVNSSLLQRGSGQGMNFGQPVDPVNVYNTEVNLIREQLYLAEQMALASNIEVMRPFTKINKTNTPNFNKILLIALAAGLLLGIVAGPMLGNFLNKKKSKKLQA